MKKAIAYLIAVLFSSIMPVTTIADCPFSMTVYIHDSEHTYGKYWGWDQQFHSAPKMPLFSGYPAMPKVLSITTLKDINPYNPHVRLVPDGHTDFSCYMKSYYSMNCHYFSIYEDETSCKADNYRQNSKFQVVIGTKASPPHPDGTPDTREIRPGRNCILYLEAGPDQNLRQYAPVNCTDNFQLDNNSLNLDYTTGNETSGKRDYIYYPEFSTPKNMPDE